MGEFKHEKYAEKYKDTVVMQLRGTFYNAFNDSAFVLNVLLGYKVNESGSQTYKAGFPIDALDKVVHICDENEVNYIAFDKGTIVAENTFSSNRFVEFCTSFDMSAISKKETVEERAVQELERGATIPNEEKQFSTERKQIVSHVQGQGLDLGNAIMNLERNLQSIIDKGKEIVCFSFVEDKNAGQGDVSQVQGIVIYK
ncbi:MAG: hypothetical protein IJ958_01130 [Agathobacter sp.]|nr:hypothetical protein [Agathobacter sp.]